MHAQVKEATLLAEAADRRDFAFEVERDRPYNLRDLYAVWRRRKVLLLAVFALLLAITVLVAFGIPPVYRSTATILIEQPQIPNDLVRSTITSYADQRIQIISQRVMTSANLVKIIEDYQLYPEQREREPMESIVAAMSEDIALEIVSADVVDPRSGRPTQATIAFSVSYDSRSPTLAQGVANKLTSLYLNENVKNRTQVAADTSGFLSKEAKKLSDEISRLEANIAEFKERNAGSLPELVELNLQLMDRAERELVEAERQSRSLQERVILLQSELAQISPTNTLYASTGRPIPGAEEQLRLVEAEYLSKAAVYSPEHPDLLKLRREMAALQQQVNSRADGGSVLDAELAARRVELSTALQRYSADHPDVKRLRQTVDRLEAGLADAPAPKPPSAQNNPAYIELRARMRAAESELKTWATKKTELLAKLEDYERRLSETPQVEREYRALVREHEYALAKHQEIKEKETEARLGESLELELKGERFALLEPPRYPEKPVLPNRLLIVALGSVFSLIGAVGATAVAENTDEAVRGRRRVQQLLGMPPLAAIPYIDNGVDGWRKWMRRLLLLTVAVAVAVLAGWLVHTRITPLDDLWFAVAGRLAF